MAVGLASFHLIGYRGVVLVSFLGISAGCTGVIGTNVKSVGPAMIHIIEEPSASVASGGSDAIGWFAGGTVGWLLNWCQCRSLCLRCHCSFELGKFLFQGEDIAS